MLLIFFLMVVPLLCVLKETAAQTGRCQLQGCPEKTDVYLKTYGYLHPNRSCTSEDIQAGLRKFQEMNINLHGLQITGECDNITVYVMSLPRCGCEDIIKFEKKMMPQNLIHGPQEYRLGSTKWRKKVLTWVVLKYPVNNRHLSQSDVDGAMRRALQIWADVTSLTFQKASSSTADITIKFVTRRHEPNPPFYDFDGRGNVLAHAFFPESGVAHFDDDEYFVLNPDKSGTELYIVAAHEFGHTLGISHSNINEALMAPFYRYSEKLELHQDDIAAVQALYGRNEAAPTNRPQPPVVTTTRPTTRSPNQPDLPAICDQTIEASFKIGDTTYIFLQERDSARRLTTTFVYTVRSDGIDLKSKTPIDEMFKKHAGGYSRAYPFRVDAAAYIPTKRYIFLFSGTRAYRYSFTNNYNGPFYLDDGFPRWMDVSEFPERPRAAVAMPYQNYDAYYMLIFGTTMVWDWNFSSERVGGWAYPIDAFGRNMPERVDSAFLQNRDTAVFIKGNKYYEFSIKYRRVMDTSTNIKAIKKYFLKGPCINQ